MTKQWLRTMGLVVLAGFGATACDDCEKDECDNDTNNQYRGQCGCANEPDLAPAGKACNDGIADGNFTCNGAGTCGNPASVAPQAGCFWKTLGTHAYWFCPAATASDAALRCNSSPGGRLVQVDTLLENTFVAHFITGSSLTGATDRTTEGEWTWRYTATLDAKQFWTGGANGNAYHGLFEAFPGGEPRNDEQLDCGLVHRNGRWSAASCSAAAPYVCERPFGASWNPGNGLQRDPQGPSTSYVDWPGRSGGGNGSTVPVTDCVPYTPGPRVVRPEYGGMILRDDTVDVFDCERDCPEGSSKTEAECRTLCTGAANPPPVGHTGRCSNTGNPSSQLAWVLPGTCSVANPDCSVTNAALGLSLVCGERTQCFEVRKRSDGNWTAQTCAAGCGPGAVCDSASQKCVDPSKFNVCDAATSEGDVCFGQCFNQVGCGAPQDISDGGYTEADRPCEEVRLCPQAGEFDGPLNGPDLSEREAIDLSQLPDVSTVPPPAYSNDFQTACAGGSCSGCSAEGGPGCERGARHPWCNMDSTLPAESLGTAAVRDTREGGRGDDSSLISFDVDPDADLDFNVEPLPFGLARFDLKAAAAIRATAKFDFVGIGGTVEIVDLRGQLTAAMCRVSTAESKLEILGADFLPGLAGDLLFDTAADQPTLTKNCEDAVNTYVDAVDRAKKAMRDAQELLKQYDDLKKVGRTFGPAFCKAVADAGVRPAGMPGANLADPCAGESPEDTVNAFVEYYQSQVKLIDSARQALADAVLDSRTLANAVGLGSLAPASNGFDFYASFGDLIKGEETTTLLSVNFFIGPVPCNLEVSSYMHYGIQGGLGVNLWPQALVDGAGDFVKAGAIIMPYADSGVTLFVGVGFDAGPLSLKVGLSGSITLANVQLPATASAGLAINPERIRAEDRPFPSDLAQISNGTVLYPPKGLSRYNFQYVYSYGVDLTLSDILSGHLDGSVIVKFFWFKKRWSQQLVAFKGLPPIGPFNLIGGGSPKPDEWPSEPVAEDTRSWTSGYDSVPFVAIAPVTPPATALTADATFSTTRVSQLFYDSLCTCEERGSECERKADCCDTTDTCFLDPALSGGTKVCSQCRAYAAPTDAVPEGINESCTVDANCCPGNTCQTGLVLRKNCVLKCEVPAFLAANQERCRCGDAAYYAAHKADCDRHQQGGFDPGGPEFGYFCETYTVPYGVCAPEPTVPDVVK